MRIAVDLHIHSALSPCAHEDMTPNNIVNMALIKGLDAIAVTDHNSCDNIRSVLAVAGDELVILPGMELQSMEEVHMLCYFADVTDLEDFEAFVVRSHLTDLKNNPQFFGRQLIMDESDEITGEREEMLISSLELSIEDVVMEVKKRGGVVVPAHIDRSSYSIISQLGFIPPEYDFNVLEISQNGLQTYVRDDSDTVTYISSSDAHCLEDILERESFIYVEERSASGILQSISRSK